MSRNLTDHEAWLGHRMGDRYRIVAAMDVGGTGAVFRGWDLAGERYAAIKLPLRDPEAVGAFAAAFDRAFAAIRATLPHPGIIPILEAGTTSLAGHADASTPFVVMPYLAGGSLRHRLVQAKDARRRPATDLWRWLPVVADALDHAHRLGIRHHAITPSNVLFDGLGRPFLADFGLAHAIREAARPTSAGDTLPHLAGAECRDLAAVIYEVLAGTPPPFNADRPAMSGNAAAAAAWRLDLVRPDLPGSLTTAVMHGLARSAADRFHSCGELAKAVLEHIPPPPPLEKQKLLCPECSHLLNVKPRFAGRPGQCPQCHVPLTIHENLESLWLARDRPDTIAAARSSRSREAGEQDRLARLEEITRAERNRSSMLAVAGACCGLVMLTVLSCRTASHSRDAAARIVAVHRAIPLPPDVNASMEADAVPGLTRPAPPAIPGNEAATAVNPAVVAPATTAEASVGPENTGGGQAPAGGLPRRAVITVEDASVGPMDEAPAAGPAPSLDASAGRQESVADERPAPWKGPAHPSASTAMPGTIVVNSVGIGLVLIPGGGVTIPNPPRAGSSRADRPAIEVRISKSFWLGQKEVTRRQWIDVMGVDPWQKDDPTDHENLPATRIGWNDAASFCQKLTKKERDAGVLPDGETYELPTEAQWEYALRSGIAASTAAGNSHRDPRDHGWFSSDSGRLHAVGTKKPIGWQLFDMEGNAREWCRDWYSDGFVGGTDPTGPAFGSYRFLFQHVCRGGSLLAEPAAAALGSDRSSGIDGEEDVGFRVARIAR